MDWVGRGVQRPVPVSNPTGMKDMTRYITKDNKNIAEIQMSVALVCERNLDIAEVLKNIENGLPSGCRVAYMDYSTGCLGITQKGLL
jgi:hypothetical protein